MNFLYLIPARGGSKGLPGKNIKPLLGKPLIYYTLDIATELADADAICVSVDDDNIISKVNEYGVEVPFKRPADLASDTAKMEDVILHALDHYEAQGRSYDAVVLLQPTSPLRRTHHVQESIDLFDESLDMIVSVHETDANPYYLLFEENEDGYLTHSKEASALDRRQDAPPVYEYNGTVFVINVQSLRKHKMLAKFEKIHKYLMDKKDAVDIDDELDWVLCEYLLKQRLGEQ
jgi:N-acylneuraminate cytidylyltransferase